MSFILTSDQKIAYEKIKTDQQRQDEGMAKFEMNFNDGKGGIMLTDQCRTKAEAFMACCEKYGPNFKEIA
jgi:hypothetical protein